MSAWPALLYDTATTVMSTIAVIGTAMVLYTGAAVAVALFHPDRKRRAEARAVLDRLLRFLRGR